MALTLNWGPENDASHPHSSQTLDQNSPQKVREEVKVGKPEAQVTFIPISFLLELRSQEAALDRCSLGSAMKREGPNQVCQSARVVWEGAPQLWAVPARAWGRARVSSSGLSQPSSGHLIQTSGGGGNPQLGSKLNQSLSSTGWSSGYQIQGKPTK